MRADLTSRPSSGYPCKSAADPTATGDGESFKISERLSGVITAIYVSIGQRYFTFNDDIRLPHRECCQRVLASAAYAEPKLLEPAADKAPWPRPPIGERGRWLKRQWSFARAVVAAPIVRNVLTCRDLLCRPICAHNLVQRRPLTGTIEHLQRCRVVDDRGQFRHKFSQHQQAFAGVGLIHLSGFLCP
jgi:hypothetical protein